MAGLRPTVCDSAEAYLFERTGKAAKTHWGLRSEFSRLARSEQRIDREYLTFLAEAYEYKSIADCGVGSTLPATTAEDARSAIDSAGGSSTALPRFPLLKPAPSESVAGYNFE